jgi:hypothetical protein
MPLEVWSGIEMAPTWKPSTNDPTGRQPIELKGVHPNNKPRGDARLAQRRQRKVRGMGTHISIACGANTQRKERNAIDYKKQSEQVRNPHLILTLFS